MAQMERLQRSSETSRNQHEAQTSPTFEQLLQADTSSGLTSISPTYARNHDHEEDHNHHNKKSVITKVKEKAKKLRYSLSGKKKHGHGMENEMEHEMGNEIHDDNITPSWGVSLEDDGEEDPEYLGAPMYESEMAPENLKETARQHPRADPVVPENHSFVSYMEHEVEREKGESTTPSKTITETVSEKLAPAYAAMSGATHTIASKIAGLTMTDSNEQETETEAPGWGYGAGSAGDGPTNLERCSEIREHPTSSPGKWDKGVSVKENFMQNFEPGEDERALSRVITKTISPRKPAGEMGVVEKMKEAVTSFLRPEEPSFSTPKSTNSSLDIPISTNAGDYTSNTNSSSHIPISNSANSSPVIPISTTSHEVVEEENHGRILQAN